MDYKKINAPSNTITRDMVQLSEQTGNVYETVMVIAKRANQLNQMIKQDLEKKLHEFETISDDMEEIHENREQIEISKFYEHLPKSTLMAAKEYEDGLLNFSIATKAKNIDEEI